MFTAGGSLRFAQAPVCYSSPGVPGTGKVLGPWECYDHGSLASHLVGDEGCSGRSDRDCDRSSSPDPRVSPEGEPCRTERTESWPCASRSLRAPMREEEAGVTTFCACQGAALYLWRGSHINRKGGRARQRPVRRELDPPRTEDRSLPPKGHPWAQPVLFFLP